LIPATLGHLFQPQRSDDLVDMGLLVDGELQVNLTDRLDQALPKFWTRITEIDNRVPSFSVQ
jgi:hypothetical protein